MAVIRFFVMGFASHQTWASGYQRASTKHDVRIEVISGERWKYRMMAACAEWEEKISPEDDILVVDGMFDVTVLMAILRSRGTNDPNARMRIPKVYVYFHENQFTTPFTSQDRDKKNNTHWHYGMAHWRSLLVADGFIFNSQTHFDAFAAALPKMINEQCPRDAVQWQLQRADSLLKTRCTILPYGLELDELVQFQSKKRSRPTPSSELPPVGEVAELLPALESVKILWNARLEEDKNPAAFLDLIHQIRRQVREGKGTNKTDSQLLPNSNCPPIQLIILGTDPSKDRKWENRIRKEFPPEMILYLGWCQDRKEYAKWLQKAHIVVSTAKHETFGISIVESVFSGALPLLPNRLSYPEIFPPETFEQDHLYSNTRKDGVEKLLHLMDIIQNDTAAFDVAKARAKTAVSTFRWAIMSCIYDEFFASLAEGDSITEAGSAAASTIKKKQQCFRPVADAETTTTTASSQDCQAETLTTAEPIVISNADDDKVALFRPKSLRNYNEYNRQVKELQKQGIEAALHGGRRTTVRMLEAISLGAKINPISFLTTQELADNLFMDDSSKKQQVPIPKEIPLYVTKEKKLLDEIRGQKLNTGDAVLCMIQFPIASELQELIQNPPILLFDNVRNAENLGSILRTAFCLGIKSIVASSTAWAALKDSRAARCSMGTMYYHRFYQSHNLQETIGEIQKQKIAVYGVEIGDNAVPVAPHGPSNNWAAVMGNEDAGLNPDIAKICDKIVFVPQAHGDSLNVGHAAAITLFELGREGPKMEHDGKAACT
ncbi:unnamed protein product [Cylindrotheca closterium]|uniref:tRNA-queuosine alpha-mannosyltransferase n=1 Tax=Cylindrotheca closterium TaxID=2856 RepID=A0AAD2G407_9STRA|nr:unnamed protein product [Cylindrotheca closterium]